MRLNLSIPPQMDALLERMCAATGRSKASFALECMSAQMGYWHRFLRAMEADNAGGAEVREAGRERLSRQQQRAAERQAAKAARRKSGK
jgi:hypothetical protein